ncbi:Predicted arabinose efflux permease, MFS family [Solimonas aquatica]|uniref:Predicted arabinose efflux permease, MFS family n=1 Tax=Solimonas aquatica TaxID=489703 RepID=A0A1H9H7N3_9GAMM|nr:Predicted arabinose efflux permease, MFS family [Solimonas aquatica]
MSRSGILILLSALYLAQGLPYGFFTQALPVLMRDAGHSLTVISLSSWLFIPWALKFIWAPYVDRVGNRKHWLLWLQLATLIGAVLLAGLDLSQTLWPLFFALLAFNFLAATQDIATDGLAVILLGSRERGLANGIQVGAYRIGMVLGGGLLLWVYAQRGFATMFLAMALLLAICTLPLLGLRLPPKTVAASPHRVHPGSWWSRLRRPGIPTLIGLLLAYKFGDSMGASLIGPFMRDQQLSLAQIALLKGTLGSLSGLAGAALGGLLAFRLPRRRVLLLGGVMQSLSLAPYALAATGAGGGFALIASATIAEHLFGGIATVALFALMMDACEPEHAGADYTLLASAVVICQGLAALAAGLIADLAGFAPMLTLSVLLSLIGCWVLLRALDRGRGPATLQHSWQTPARRAAQ